MTGFTESIETFHASAQAHHGLDDFGEDDYLDALAVLCRSLDEDANLTPAGVGAVETMIVDALEARLFVEEGWNRFPEVAQAKVERPLIIVGLPRTGTTALHHLIARDPGMQALEHWLERRPKPRPARGDWEADSDYRAAAERVDMIFARSPEMRAIHQIEAYLPDECWNLFSQNFAHSSWEGNLDVAQYARWWATCDMTPTYRRHRRNAQLIGHREPQRRWLFKDATHLFNLDALLSVYPDAMIVQTHRDPTRLIPSVCSLCWSSRSPLNMGTDPAAFGQSTLELWERAIGNMMETRRRLGPDAFYDLPFEHFIADPVAAIAGIYRHFGMEWSNQAESAIRAFYTQGATGKHGEHTYSATEWGIDPGEITERFSDYVREFNVEVSR